MRERGGRNERQRQLDSAIGWERGGLGRERNGGERQSRVVRMGNDGERRGRAGGKGRERSPEAAGCLFFAWPAPRGNLASVQRC